LAREIKGGSVEGGRNIHKKKKPKKEHEDGDNRMKRVGEREEESRRRIKRC